MAPPHPVAAAAQPHVVLFPFMSKGHTIPLLHLSRLLVCRRVNVTVFTTKANRPFISQFLGHRTEVCVVELPFPSDIKGVPEGVESTDKLPTMSLFVPFVTATKRMQPHFEQALESLSGVICVVSDGFLYWTLQSASKFGIPRVSFYGMNGYSSAVTQEVGVNRLMSGPESDDELITVTRFPWIKVTRNDFDEPFNRPDPSGPYMDFVIQTVIATTDSYGVLVNSFYELEPQFIDYMNHEPKQRNWCVGPLCLAELPPSVEPGSNHVHVQKPKWFEWLDRKLAQGRPVLYIAFGSQAELSGEQLEAIAKGLEESKVNFLWVVRKYEGSLLEELQERVAESGMIVGEWVDQRAILNHSSVKGFLSHCGWNSVLEGICSAVPILAWPMMAEQHLNARMVVEEIKIGLRVETRNGSVRGFVTPEGLKKTVKELMEGERGKEARNKVKEVSEAAKEAMAEGGSSWRSLNELLNELHSVKDSNAGCFPTNGQA